MKWFEITTSEEAQALKPYYLNTDGLLIRPKIGDRVTPSSGCATVTAWPDYPEADRITFTECMAILRDDVTVEVMADLGDVYRSHRNDGIHYVLPIVEADGLRFGVEVSPVGVCQWRVDEFKNHRGEVIPNLTATKLRILVAILKGEQI